MQCVLVPPVFGTVSSLHPTSFLMIFILVYIYTHVWVNDDIHLSEDAWLRVYKSHGNSVTPTVNEWYRLRCLITLNDIIVMCTLTRNFTILT